MHETFEQVLDRFLKSAILELSWLRDAAIELQKHLRKTGYDVFEFEWDVDKPAEKMVFVFDSDLKIEVLGSEILVESSGNSPFIPVPEGVWTCKISKFVAPNFGK